MFNVSVCLSVNRQVFCQSIVEDIRKRKELEKKFPGALMEVVYDGFVQDPVTYTQKIYEFLEVNIQDVSVLQACIILYFRIHGVDTAP